MRFKILLGIVSILFMFNLPMAIATTVTFQMPSYIQNNTNPTNTGAADFFIQFPRLCSAHSNTCPYQTATTTDTTGQASISWSCVNSNCLYTNINQSQAAGITASGSTIYVTWGNPGSSINILKGVDGNSPYNTTTGIGNCRAGTTTGTVDCDLITYCYPLCPDDPADSYRPQPPNCGTYACDM